MKPGRDAVASGHLAAAVRWLAALAVLAGIFVAWPARAVAQSGAASKVVRLADLGYNDDTLLGQRFSSDYFLPGPGEYSLANSGSVLTLVYSSSGLVGPSSIMTVTWNNVPVRDVRLTGGDTRQTVHIPLPSDRIDPALNRLRISGAMEDQSNTCGDDNPANHVTIFKGTAVSYALLNDIPHPKPMKPDLSRYPAPFFEAAPVAPSSIVFMLPAHPSPAELRAAVAVSSGLGRMAGSHPLQLSVATDTGKLSSNLSDSNIIYVGLAKDLPGLHGISQTSTSFQPGGTISREGQPVPLPDGVLSEVQSPLNPGRMTLAVTGQTDQALIRAASALSANDTARLLGGSSAIINGLQLASASPRPAAAANRNVITLDQLGRADQTVTGIGDHDLTFKVPLSGLPQGRATLALDLVTSHSPLLDQARSSFRVLLNGVPLTSVGLNQVGTTRAVSHIQLPTAALHPGLNSFDVIFTLRTARFNTTTNQVCPPVPTEQAWAVLHSSSSVQLPARVASPTSVSFSDYPFPFVGSNGLAQTELVVPATFDATPLARFAADIGRSLPANTPPPLVVRAADFKPRTANDDIIVWGTPDQNPVLSQLGQFLPLSIQVGPPQRFAFANNILLSVQDAAHLGVLQEIISPWFPNRRVLVVSATEPGSVPLAVRGINQPGLANNLAVVSVAPPPSQATGLGRPLTPPVQVTTYSVKPPGGRGSSAKPIAVLPIVLAAGLAVLALLMASSMAYEAFVREPRKDR